MRVERDRPGDGVDEHEDEAPCPQPEPDERQRQERDRGQGLNIAVSVSRKSVPTRDVMAISDATVCPPALSPMLSTTEQF